MAKFINEQVYSNEKKRELLLEFITSLEFLIANPDLKKHYPDAAENYEECLAKARSLVASGFIQEDLYILSRAFRPVLWTFRDWSPPLIQMDDGCWREPDWYPPFEKAYERASKASMQLRYLGELDYSD